MKVYLLIGHFRPECTPQFTAHNGTWIEGVYKTLEAAELAKRSSFVNIQGTYEYLSIEAWTVQ